MCEHVKHDSKGVHLSCFDGTITEFPFYGVFAAGSQAELEKTCLEGLDNGVVCDVAAIYKEKLEGCLG